MSKYSYGLISKTKKWYVRLSEWKGVYDNMGDLQPFCRVLKTFRCSEECRKYIEYLKEHEKEK